jgi:CxxC-x17-CxxC domain-containing protein
MLEGDKVLKCRDCGEEFVFTAGEQAFYKERGFQHEPTRCRSCREKRKTQGPGASMGGGGGNAYASSGGGGGGGGSREFHTAVCSNCGVTTQVPFKPTPGKPVYCRDCFQSSRATRGVGA